MRHDKLDDFDGRHEGGEFSRPGADSGSGAWGFLNYNRSYRLGPCTLAKWDAERRIYTHGERVR